MNNLLDLSLMKDLPNVFFVARIKRCKTAAETMTARPELFPNLNAVLSRKNPVRVEYIVLPRVARGLYDLKIQRERS